MKRIFLFSLIFGSLLCFNSCDPENVIDTPNNNPDTLDYVWDNTQVIKIQLNTNSITCASSNVEISGQTALIKSKGTYELSGTLENGQIVVNTSGIVRLLFNNVNITNQSSAAIYVIDAKRAIFMLLDGTDNIISDGPNYVMTADSINATIYSRDYTAIAGKGKLTVNANYNGGIYSRDELVIESGDIQVKSVGTAIKGKDYLKINGGKFNIRSGGDAIKSDKDSTLNYGFIEINDGEFDIISDQDGITAQAELRIKKGKFNITTGGGSTFIPGLISTKGLDSNYRIKIDGGEFVLDCADNSIDADDHVIINGGEFNLKSGNKPLDSDSTMIVNGGKINITKATKGLSSHKITINGGSINVSSRNDCLKASLRTGLTEADGSLLTINSGLLLLSSDKGDALDSNGSILMTGGTVIVQGAPTKPDCAIAYRTAFKMDGGKLYGVGADSMLPQAESAQNTVAISFGLIQPPGQIYCIQNETGETIAVLKTERYSYLFTVSIPELQMGGTYQIYTGGTVTGTDFGGYYVNAVYTAGLLKKTFTITEKVTSIKL